MKYHTLLPLLVTLTLAGCGASRRLTDTGDAYLIQIDQGDSHNITPNGRFVEVQLWSPGTRLASRSAGELIAVDNDNIYVATDARTVTRYPQENIQSIRFRSHWRNNHSSRTVMSLGLLSTITHGYFLLLSVPAWILTGTIAGQIDKQQRSLDASTMSPFGLSHYARFPAGLPNNWIVDDWQPIVP